MLARPSAMRILLRLARYLPRGKIRTVDARPRRIPAGPTRGSGRGSGMLARLLHPRALLLRPRRADRGLDVLLFLRRREHRRHPEGLDPQLTAPALGVIQVFVFLVLDLL